MSSNRGGLPDHGDADPGAEVPVRDAITAVAAGAWLLDVREREEWDTVHVPGAHLIPLASIPERQDELPHDGTIYVICRSGARSRAVTDALVAANHRAVNVAGGMNAWQSCGGPIASTDPR